MRPRRLRGTPALRRLTAETRLDPAELVLPLFVREGAVEPVPITSMPGVVNHTRDSLRAAAEQAARAGLGGVMLFGVPATRDAIRARARPTPTGILNVAVRDVVAEVGDDLVVMADLCLDEFTDHGHCGVLVSDGPAAGSVDNDATLVRYAEMGVALAEAGAHVVGASGMMDGQVGAVRAALDGSGHADTVILAYAAKYASALYGPFREAVDSALTGDRRTYQQDPANRRESLREVALDVAEAADIVMVKPAGTSLDVIAEVAASVDIPVAAYQVSGEYAMLEAAAAQGWIDRERAILETLTVIRRAGADIVLTYWAAEVAGWLAGGRADAAARPPGRGCVVSAASPVPRTTPRSQAWFDRALAVAPGGVNSPVRAFRAVGGTPRFMASGTGPYLTDVDGNHYVDLVCSWGPMILGHAHPAVVAAVGEAVARGLLLRHPRARPRSSWPRRSCAGSRRSRWCGWSPRAPRRPCRRSAWPAGSPAVRWS